jgi:hypothetical protein
MLIRVCTRPFSNGWVRSRSPIHRGGDERAWGRGNSCGPEKTGTPRFPDGRGHGARGRTQTRIEFCPADSGGRHREAASAPDAQSVSWQGSHEAAPRGKRFRAARRRGCLANTSVVCRAKRDARRQAAGRTVGSHALPMHLVDRMESLKERKGRTQAPGKRRSRTGGEDRTSPLVRVTASGRDAANQRAPGNDNCGELAAWSVNDGGHSQRARSGE